MALGQVIRGISDSFTLLPVRLVRQIIAESVFRVWASSTTRDRYRVINLVSVKVTTLI